MRTTMDLPKDLLEEAKTMAGTVILSLQKLIQSKKIERLRSLSPNGTPVWVERLCKRKM